MKIIVADDHGMLRDTLMAYFENEPDMEARMAKDFDEAVDIILEEGDFDLALLDYNMPGMTGLECIEKFRDKTGVNQVAIISGIEKRSMAQACIDQGACGFLPKTMQARSMMNAIRFMAEGDIFIPTDFLTQEDDQDNGVLGCLSKREKDVLRFLLKGETNKGIGLHLDIQESTVKLHMKAICSKLGARSRVEAALIAEKAGFS